jgi:sulfate/thiosulfate transport system ATP-binding protein
VKLELTSGEGGGLIQVELAREQFERLALRSGEQLFVKPRRMRVFVDGAGTDPRTSP